MAGYPKYVRLADHLAMGIRADLESGFSIAGFDVVETPDQEKHPAAAAFIKAELAAGRFESASKAEYDEVHPDVLGDLGYEVTKKVEVAVVPQEGLIQKAVGSAHREMRAGRAVPAEDAEAVDEERRKATLKEQRKAERAAKRGSRGSQEAEEDDSDAEGTDDDEGTQEEPQGS